MDRTPTKASTRSIDEDFPVIRQGQHGKQAVVSGTTTVRATGRLMVATMLYKSTRATVTTIAGRVMATVMQYC